MFLVRRRTCVVNVIVNKEHHVLLQEKNNYINLIGKTHVDFAAECEAAGMRNGTPKALVLSQKTVDCSLLGELQSRGRDFK